jgi:hydroxymethylglutaryl-CoA reductase
MRDSRISGLPVHGRAAGKVILLGEHAAVYGRHVLALPIPGAVEASLRETDEDERFVLHDGDGMADDDVIRAVAELVRFITRRLGVAERRFEVRLRTRIPPGMGLGASAAVAVGIIRALDAVLGLGLDDAAVNELAFECERLAHGHPSGIDNTVATFGKPVLFRKDAGCVRVIELSEAPPFVVASGSIRGITREQVRAVRARYEKNRDRYGALFDEIDAISTAGARALVDRDYDALGDLMNVCHGLLNALQVSVPQLETMVHVARTHGATGAKLTGAGGGGSIVALAPGRTNEVARALQEIGCRIVTIMGQ